MNTITKKMIRLLLPLVVVMGALILVSLAATAAPVTIPLCASTGTITMPDGTAVPVWGFVRTAPCVSGLVSAANFPGPVLEVNAGDVVTISLSSALPGTHTASFELSGLPVTPLGGGQYQFTASRAGTFVYQSDGDAGRQMAMGLYGTLIVRPVGEAAGFSSGNCSTAGGSAYGNAFDRECVLVLSQVDPAFNAAPDTYTMTNSFMANTETIPAGGTEDAITTMPAIAPPNANGFPLFNRNLHVTNGSTAAGTYATPGGMLIFIHQ